MVATVDDYTSKAIARLARRAHAVVGGDPHVPTSAVRMVRSYFGRRTAVLEADAERLDGRVVTMRLDGVEATFAVRAGAPPKDVQRELAREFARYLLFFATEFELEATEEAIAFLARHLTVTGVCVLDDVTNYGGDVAALADWWMLSEEDAALRIHEVLRASMPSGVVRTAAPLRLVSRSA